MTQKLCCGLAALTHALFSTKSNNAASCEKMDLIGGTEMTLDCIFLLVRAASQCCVKRVVTTVSPAIHAWLQINSELKAVTVHDGQALVCLLLSCDCGSEQSGVNQKGHAATFLPLKRRPSQ